MAACLIHHNRGLALLVRSYSEFNPNAKTPKGRHIPGLFFAHRLQLGDGNLGGFHERDHFATDHQFQLFH
jgi:hypothetical protein